MTLDFFGFNRMIVCLFFFEIEVLFQQTMMNGGMLKITNIWYLKCGGLIGIMTSWYVIVMRNDKVSLYSFELGNYYLNFQNNYLS